MDIWKFFAVGHRNHTFCNPMSETKFDELIDRLALQGNARVLDIACGKAEMLVRVTERFGCSGVGVDQSPPFVEEGRKRVSDAELSDDIEIIEGEGSAYDAAPETFDLAMCIGASWIFGGHGKTLDALCSFTKPGGLVVVGEPHWLKEPAPEYLASTGLEHGTFSTHRGNVDAGLDRGLGFLYTIVATHDDWDRYEGLQFDAAERYAVAHPDDPDVPAILGGIRKRREEYLNWGRDSLGWAVYLFMKDPVAA